MDLLYALDGHGRRTHDVRDLPCISPVSPTPTPTPTPTPNPRTSRASSAARLMRYGSQRRLLCAGRLPTPCLPRAYCCPPRAYPVPTPCPHAGTLPTRRDPLLTAHSRARVRRLKNHVQVRAVLRDSVDPYALEELNVDFDSY